MGDVARSLSSLEQTMRVLRVTMIDPDRAAGPRPDH
jgi:hypothetical protein